MIKSICTSIAIYNQGDIYVEDLNNASKKINVLTRGSTPPLICTAVVPGAS